MEAVVVVAVAGLDEDGAVGEALGVHLAPHVVQVHSWTRGVQCSSSHDGQWQMLIFYNFRCYALKIDLSMY